ncbi:MAG: NYN domain-containing protein [Clostridiales bacterium]|nr:NYN domain-containing protein [Clostridiales bacterium]
MPEQPKKTPCGIGVLAHVDAGKTTLSEALLYCSGERRTLGRVDHGDAYLDSHNLERERGITIFSKQARLETDHRQIILVDTPGHVDFSAEAERTMPVLDCAVLVISGTDGVQAHTVTLWRLLERYQVPVFLFINKMDLPGADREKLLAQLQQQLSPGCVDFGMAKSEIAEAAAMCDEGLLESYLATGAVTDGNLRGLIQGRKLFPCCFGAALKLTGVEQLLALLDTYAPQKEYGSSFAARVYKISRDAAGTRLTWVKVTGGSLKVRQNLRYTNRKGDALEEKLVQLRLYSGDKFTAPEEVNAGQLAAITGLSATYVGQSLGAEPEGQPPVLEPVMTYRVNLPKGCDPAQALPKLRQLEEEGPQLHLLWEDGQIHVQIMGRVQLEIFRSLVQQRFGLEITLDDRRIFYKETILDTVEGVGHFEPLRHYAECHILLEPLPQGSGLVLDTVCPLDVLDGNYQNLILTHLAEKTHRGVLIGAPITDMKLTLLVGKAHLKHTEGGDFRQATYRAVRQGLMQAKSQLLEPWYDFAVTAPTELIGRAITDIRSMGGEFEAPESQGAVSTLKGMVPASEVRDYADQLAAYTQGRGRLQLSLHGYAPCHNTQAVVEAAGYDPEADLDNTPDSVFCAHGAGFNVKWNQVKDYMHLESGLKEEKPPQIIPRASIDDKELERIMEREFGPISRRQYAAPASRPATEEVTIRQPKQRCIIVDGYNIIFAWESLANQAKSDLDAARRQLCDALSSYAGFTKHRLVVVFDGYKQKGSTGEKSQFHNIQVVFTREGQTADRYIEELAAEIGNNYAVRVASSDGLVQLSSFRSGVLRMSARELQDEVENAHREMGKYFRC